MGSNALTCHPLSPGDVMGSMYPMVNPKFNAYGVAIPRKTKRIVEAYRLAGTAAAIGTDVDTYTLFTTDDVRTLVAAYVLDPVGLGVDATNYNTFVISKTGPVTMASRSTAYGFTANELHEITLANTVAHRTLAATNVVYLVVTGTVAGVVINPNTLLFLVFDDA